ncbi:MAG: type II toxin-antitoxin system HicA family toxin [Chloroflexota bacterium]
MAKRDKRLQKLRNNPQNVSLEELRQILEDHGFWLDRIVGSHHVFRAEVGEQTWKVVIPFHKPVKIVYVKQALAAIDEINLLDLSEGEADGESKS